MSEFSDFTKLVLARLETNPDEFQLGGRWDTLVRGIEAYVRDDKDDRYYRTLWPLDDPEIHVIVAAYRKAYLARLHKDMLKNIVSGDDLPKYAEPIKGTLRGANPSTVLTASAMQQSTLATLNQSFDDAYDVNRMAYGAAVKGEGQPIADSAIADSVTYKATNRYSLNSTQLAIAKKLGIDPDEYAKRIGATE